MKKLAAAQKREIATLAAKTDATIDFSEMPEVTDWSDAEVGLFYRPTKRPVTMRLDEDVIDWLKSFGRGYQTKANHLLRHAMEASRDRHLKPDPQGAFVGIQGAISRQIEIVPQFDDDSDFIAQVEKIVSEILRRYNPAKLALIKIDNWFDWKWLGFSGKPIPYVAQWNLPSDRHPKAQLRIPPFVPARIVSQRRFCAPDYRQISSHDARFRIVSEQEPNTALAWYSGNSRGNGRGALMVYLPTNGSYWPWYAELERGETWRICKTEGISTVELAHWMEESSDTLAGLQTL